MYDQAIKTYEEAKRHLDHKGFTRMYGRIKWELESKKTVSAYKKAKRRLDSRRVEGEIVYDHNTRNFRLYSDSLESRRLEEKTKREIASEMIITRSYHSLLHEMTRPDTETFKDVYGAAERISSNEDIKINPGRHEEFLTILRTINQCLKEMTQTIIASESSIRNISMFQSAFRDAIQENKDIEGWISDINNPLANKQKVIIKVRRRKYLQNEQVSRIIRDNHEAMELAESCAPNEAIEIYDQLIRARVEGGIVFDRNTGNFVTYDQAGGSGLDGEDDPGPHSDQNRNAVEPSDPPDHPQETHYQARDTYEEAKRHSDPKRAEGETAYDHNTGKLEQRTDNSSGHPETDGELSDDKTKREIASELFIIRSYYHVLHEMNRPDKGTFKEAYDDADFISSKENITIKPGKLEEFLTLLRTTNQRLKEMTKTIIANDRNFSDLFMFRCAVSAAILGTKDIEGGISGIKDDEEAMKLAESYKPNEAIEIYDQLIRAKASVQST